MKGIAVETDAEKKEREERRIYLEVHLDNGPENQQIKLNLGFPT